MSKLRCDVDDLKQRFDALQLQHAHMFTGFFGSDLFQKSMGFVTQLAHTKKTPEGKIIRPYLCVVEDPHDSGCVLVGGYFGPTKQAWEYRDPPYVPWEREKKLKQWMEGTGAQLSILVGKTRFNDDFVRFYKLAEDGKLEMEFAVPHTKTTPITLMNVRKMCKFLGVS